MRLDVVVPICVTRGLNAREHHMVRAKRVKAEREATHLALLDHASAIAHELIGENGLGARVTLLRPFARTPLDTDNLSGAFKGVRDEVAASLGVDDKSERIHWRYVQCKAGIPHLCDDATCRSSTRKKKDGQCLPCFNADQSKMHIRIRIEIVPASDVDPMAAAVTVLRGAIDDICRLNNASMHLARRDCLEALATADALATFDASGMYQSR